MDVPSSARLSAAGVLLLALFGTVPAMAQEEAPCVAALDTAEAYYVDQEFDVAETLLRECLNRPDVSEETAIEVHRLLTLVYLRQDELSEAKQIVVRLLGISFDYTPDPVLDPPSYVALVESIKESLRVEREEALTELPPDTLAAEAVPPDVRPQPSFRTGRTLYLHASFGAGSYGGERGEAADWLVEEFTANSGVSLSLGAGFSVNETLTASVSYRLHRIPSLFTLRAVDRREGGAAEIGSEFENRIEPEASSKWVHLFMLGGRAYYRPEGRASSYVELGLSASISRINDAVNVGFGPHGGLGLDVTLTPRLAGFAGLSATLIFPGDAVDHIDANKETTSPRSSDLLSFAEIGIRYRVRAW